MIHQSTIHLRGREKALTVPKAVAEQVAKIFSDKNVDPDYSFNLGNKIFFRKGQIRDIEVLPDIAHMTADKDRDEFYADEKKTRQRLLGLSPSQRSNELEMFRCMYVITTGDEPSSEKLNEARRVQEQFFTAHPKRLLCDPSRLKSLIPIVPSKKINLFQAGYFRIVTKAISRDIELANESLSTGQQKK